MNRTDLAVREHRIWETVVRVDAMFGTRRADVLDGCVVKA